MERGRDFWTRHESRIDEQIRLATEAGAFENLPGAGKPLRWSGKDDENWWVREKLRSEGVSADVLLPPSLLLRKEVDALADTVRDLPDEAAVRRVAGDLDRRVVAWIRVPTGPRVPVRRVDVEAVVARWRAERRPAPDAAPAPPVRSAPPSGGQRRPWWRRVLGR